jgi:hypothetical protein
MHKQDEKKRQKKKTALGKLCSKEKNNQTQENKASVLLTSQILTSEDKFSLFCMQ